MGFELWLMCELVQFPHVLYSSHSLTAFAIDAGYDFLIIQAITLGTGYHIS